MQDGLIDQFVWSWEIKFVMFLLKYIIKHL